MKKILIIFIFINLNIFTFSNILDDLYKGSIIEIIENNKVKTPNLDEEKFLIDNSKEILDVVTWHLYSFVEDHYNEIKNSKYNKISNDDSKITISQKISIFKETLSYILNYYGYENTGVDIEINDSKKTVEVKIKNQIVESKYNQQIYELLIINMAKDITTEEYKVKISTLK